MCLDLHSVPFLGYAGVTDEIVVNTGKLKFVYSRLCITERDDGPESNNRVLAGHKKSFVQNAPHRPITPIFWCIFLCPVEDTRHQVLNDDNLDRMNHLVELTEPVAVVFMKRH